MRNHNRKVTQSIMLLCGHRILRGIRPLGSLGGGPETYEEYGMFL